MDAARLATHKCLFGGGTVIALLHGEYRESRDVDFLVSDAEAYRAVRGIVTTEGMAGLFKAPPKQLREVRMDQYGIRTLFEVDGVPIKFEIVREARIEFDHPPRETVCGVRTLTHVDQVAEKLLANSDRWAADEVDSRDLIDLAMMLQDGRIPAEAIKKANQAYSTIEADLAKARAHIERPGRLAQCLANMQMSMPPAQVLARIHKLRPAAVAAKRPRP